MVQNKNKRDRLAARLARGSQPARRRKKGKRFSADNQPKRGRGRPRGAKNLATRGVIEAFLGGVSDCGADGKGTGGLRGWAWKLAMEDMKTTGMLLRAFIPADRPQQTEESGSITITILNDRGDEVKRIEDGRVIDVTPTGA